jgi:uncharacterized damage-inducible protein DinB
MTTVQEMVQELEYEALATRRCLERVSESQLDWRPHPKSLSLGQLAMHVATLPGTLAEICMRDDFEVGTPIPRPSATSIAELLATLEGSVDHAKRIVSAMDEGTLASPWRMMHEGNEVGRVPRGAFLRTILLNHWYHHRGQLTVYLRETGALVPAIYGDSADEQARA